MSFVPSFRTARWLRTINLVLQAVLFTTFFAGLNYVALHYNWRQDLTLLRKHSLSAETRSYIENLGQPVKIYVTLPPKSKDPLIEQAYKDATELLNEYAYLSQASNGARISIEPLDVFLNSQKATQLGIDQTNAIIVICGDKRRVITTAELYRIENKEKKAFTGEQAFTAAILDVSSSEKKVIYFLTGHGELKLESVDPQNGLSELRSQLQQRNFDVQTLNLSSERAIPDKAALIVSAGPQNLFTPFEEELLRQYLTNKAGRFLLLLPHGHAQHGLENLFYDWGIVAKDVVIYDPTPAAHNDNGDLLLSATRNKHPVTELLANNDIQVSFGLCRSFNLNPSRRADESIIATELIKPSPAAWGEKNYLRVPERDASDLKADLLCVAYACERVTTKANLPFSIRGGRMVAVGNANFIANGRISYFGNLTFGLSAINWLVDSDTQLNIPARPIEKFQLNLSTEQLLHLRYSLLFGLPAAAALLGLIVYWTRRN